MNRVVPLLIFVVSSGNLAFAKDYGKEKASVAGGATTLVYSRIFKDRQNEILARHNPRLSHYENFIVDSQLNRMRPQTTRMHAHDVNRYAAAQAKRVRMEQTLAQDLETISWHGTYQKVPLLDRYRIEVRNPGYFSHEFQDASETYRHARTPAEKQFFVSTLKGPIAEQGQKIDRMYGQLHTQAQPRFIASPIVRRAKQNYSNELQKTFVQLKETGGIDLARYKTAGKIKIGMRTLGIVMIAAPFVSEYLEKRENTSSVLAKQKRPQSAVGNLF